MPYTIMKNGINNKTNNNNCISNVRNIKNKNRSICQNKGLKNQISNIIVM